MSGRKSLRKAVVKTMIDIPCPPADALVTIAHKPSSRSKYSKSELKHTTGVFTIYVRRLCQSMSGDDNKMNVSVKALAVMNSILEDLGDKMSTEAHRIAAYNKRKTVTPADAMSAVRIVLHGKLGENAVSEGMRCVSSYDKIGKLIKTSDLSASRNEKCQLILPVSRVQTLLRSKTHLRVSETSAIYLCAALEHVATKILTCCIITLKQSEIKTIQARHIRMVVENDTELTNLFKNTSFITG